jgi:hypothetical protein
MNVMTLAEMQAKAAELGLPSIPMVETIEPVEIPVQPKAVTEEIPQPIAAAPESDGVTDEEIIATAVEHFRNRWNHAEVKAKLLDEFDGIENDADELTSNAYDKFFEEREKEIEDIRKEAGDATDKRLEAEREADNHLVEKYQIAGRLDKSIDTNDKERAARIIRMHEEEEAEKEEKEETFDESGEVFPESPVFPGALTDVARAMYPSLPLEFKQWGLITRWGLLRSGLDRLENEEHLQPRFYTVLVCPPNRGKTASINESRKAISAISKMATDAVNSRNNTTPVPRPFAHVENLPSADSGPFLVQEFYNVAKEALANYQGSVCSDNAAKILLDPDELSDVFEKARTSNARVSTLFIELLKLHSNNRTGNGTKQTGNRPVDNAHLAVLAGTTVKKYPMLWTGTGGGADGLVSRFLAITTNAPQVPPVPKTSDFAAMDKLYKRLSKLVRMPGQIVRLSDEAASVLNDWWSSIDSTKDSAARILESVKQLVIVLAVTNLPEDHDENAVVVVPAELMKSAIQFGVYEIAVRERLNPDDSWTHVQAMENTIIAWAKKYSGRRLPKSKNDFRRGIHPQTKPGGLGTFEMAWRNCVSTGVLKSREQGQRGARFSL